MLYNAVNGSVATNGAVTDYIAFGKGDRALMILPGVGDGLRTVRGMALPFAALYRLFAAERRVYVFSRRNALPEGFATSDMAEDVYAAMAALGINRADVVGVSQGGMIAQHLAAAHPEAVERLVLAVSAARCSDTLREVVNGWVALALAGDFKGLMLDTAERSYTEGYLKRYKKMLPFVKAGGGGSMERFIVEAQSCVTHDASSVLPGISAPTLVIGGGRDAIVGKEAARELAELLPQSRLFIYPELGHGAYEEAKDFNQRVLDFIKSE